MPGKFGRVNGTWPFGVFELSGDALTLRLQPRPLIAIFGARGFEIRPQDGFTAFPVRAPLGTRGVGISDGRRDGYFWTFGAPELLTALEAAGFDVSWDERRANVI